MTTPTTPTPTPQQMREICYTPDGRFNLAIPGAGTGIAKGSAVRLRDVSTLCRDFGVKAQAFAESLQKPHGDGNTHTHTEACGHDHGQCSPTETPRLEVVFNASLLPESGRLDDPPATGVGRSPDKLREKYLKIMRANMHDPRLGTDCQTLTTIRDELLNKISTYAPSGSNTVGLYRQSGDGDGTWVRIRDPTVARAKILNMVEVVSNSVLFDLEFYEFGNPVRKFMYRSDDPTYYISDGSFCGVSGGAGSHYLTSCLRITVDDTKREYTVEPIHDLTPLRTLNSTRFGIQREKISDQHLAKILAGVDGEMPDPVVKSHGDIFRRCLLFIASQ